MDDDEATKSALARHQIGGDLTNLSVSELEALVTALNEEIARIETEIEDKQTTRASAETVFKL